MSYNSNNKVIDDIIHITLTEEGDGTFGETVCNLPYSVDDCRYRGCKTARDARPEDGALATCMGCTALYASPPDDGET